MAINGIFYGSTSNAWIKPKIEWSAIQNAEGNYYDVTATLYYTRTNEGYTTGGYWSGSLTINGDTKKTSSSYITISGGSYTAAISHTVRVMHNSDGEKTITISAAGSISSTTLTSTTISQQIALDPIPRAAAISATDADIGSVSIVTIAKRNDLYTHTIAYRFGTLSGYITENGVSPSAVYLKQTSIAFTIPESFYYEIPDAPSGVCTLTCTTYQNGVLVGSPNETSFIVRANRDKCRPLVTAYAVDVNAVTSALTGDSSKMVRYASNMRCTIDCQARFGASIKEKKIAGAVVSTDSLTIAQIDVDTILFLATDSRGFTSQIQLSPEVIQYFPPTGKFSVSRVDDTSGNANLRAEGTWFSESFGYAYNSLQLAYRIDGGSWQNISVTKNGNQYSVNTQISGLEYTSAHSIELNVSDSIETLILSARVNPGVPVFDWGQNDFKFNVPVSAPKVTGLAVPQNNSDAASKEYVDTLKLSLREEISTKISMALLWENETPTSAFAAQTIALDLSKYDFIEVYFAKANNDAKNWICYRMPIGYDGDPFHMSHIQNTSRASVISSRHTSVTTAGVEFGGGFYKYTSSNTGGAENESMIPCRIYGIKGVDNTK